MTYDEKEHIRMILDVLYKGAGLNGWNGNINESVAKVVSVMLCEVNKCSRAMNFVLRPPIGLPTAGWLFTQVGRSIIDTLRSGQYKICQLKVISNFQTILSTAEVFDETLGLPSCE